MFQMQHWLGKNSATHLLLLGKNPAPLSVDGECEGEFFFLQPVGFYNLFLRIPKHKFETENLSSLGTDAGLTCCCMEAPLLSSPNINISFILLFRVLLPQGSLGVDARVLPTLFYHSVLLLYFLWCCSPCFCGSPHSWESLTSSTWPSGFSPANTSCRF